MQTFHDECQHLFLPTELNLLPTQLTFSYHIHSWQDGSAATFTLQDPHQQTFDCPGN
jgi:hypothetical protein